jgi:lysophospholipase L1-like esterase
MNNVCGRLLAAGLGLILAVSWDGPALAGQALEAKPAAVFGMLAEPCPPPLDLPPPVQAFNAAFIAPGKVDMPRMLALTQDPAFVAYNAAKSAREAADWAGLCRYRRDNDAIVASGKSPKAVFFGDSITENWVLGDPGLFGADVVGRGIGGQTSAQMLVRFRSDVIDLRPRVVQILAGTNDIAGNRGPTSERDFQNNIMAMVELARAHRIRVVLASIPPAARFFWRPEVAPGPQIARLNTWLRDYARRERLTFIDYHAMLAGPEGAMRPGLSLDGVHPNRDGYALMRPLAWRVH